jgi:hypothetical protein
MSHLLINLFQRKFYIWVCTKSYQGNYSDPSLLSVVSIIYSKLKSIYVICVKTGIESLRWRKQFEAGLVSRYRAMKPYRAVLLKRGSADLLESVSCAQGVGDLGRCYSVEHRVSFAKVFLNLLLFPLLLGKLEPG